MSIELKSVMTSADLKRITSIYDFKNWGGDKYDTCLTLELRAISSFGKTKVAFTDLEVEGDSQEEALDKLATWMERAARELRKRPKPTAVAFNYV